MPMNLLGNWSVDYHTQLALATQIYTFKNCSVVLCHLLFNYKKCLSHSTCRL